jgi:hypothetical protein
MVSEAPVYQCFLCKVRFHIDSGQAYYLASRKVVVCRACIDAAREGVQPAPDILEKLTMLGIEPALTELGYARKYP